MRRKFIDGKFFSPQFRDYNICFSLSMLGVPNIFGSRNGEFIFVAGGGFGFGLSVELILA